MYKTNIYEIEFNIENVFYVTMQSATNFSSFFN